MLRAADRLGRKWRAMASGIVERSKREMLTAGNLRAAGALVAAVGVGALAGRWIARPKAREEQLRFDLERKQAALETMLLAHTTDFKNQIGNIGTTVALLENKLGANERAVVDMRRERQANVDAHSLVGGAFAGLEKTVETENQERGRRADARIATLESEIHKHGEALRGLETGSRRDDEGRLAAIERRVEDLATSISDRGGSHEGSGADAMRANLTASILALTASLAEEAERSQRTTASGLGLIDDMQDQISTASRVLDELNKHLHDANALREKVNSLEGAVEALYGASGATEVMFGRSEPLVLTLARALSAVGQSARRKIAETMADVLVARAALDAHRKRDHSRRASDLYTTA